MTMNLGYLVGTGIFLSALVVLVVLQILAKKFHPFLYWATIIALTTAGTVRRQNIWDSWGPDLKESWPHLGLIFRLRFFGVASADVRWSAV